MRSTLALSLLGAAAVAAGLLVARQQRQAPTATPANGDRVRSGQAQLHVLPVSPDRLRAVGL
jgi:hypothetical protein